MPAAIDVTPPVVDGFVINDGAPTTSVLAATLDVTATDPLPNPSGAKSRVAFNAPVTGTYQIEVHGYTAAHYQLTLGSQAQAASLQSARAASLQSAQAAQSAKPLPAAPAVPLDSWPHGRAVRPPDWPGETNPTQHRVFLPLLVR